MKKKHWKMLALAAALALLAGLGWFANAMVGNPVSRYLAERSAEKYLSENHPGTDLSIDRVTYSFKDGRYHAFVSSPSSVDTYFSIAIEMTGKVKYNTYDSVTKKFNTASRLDQEYRELTETAFEHPSFPYELHIGYGRLEIYPKEFLEDPDSTDIPDYALVQDELVLDRVYDIRELGAQAGHLIVYADSDTITAEEAAGIMLDIRQCMEEAGIPFRTMDFHLQLPRPEEGPRPEGSVDVKEFPCEEIYEEGMADRVRQADRALKAYYAELDGEK